MKYSVLISTIAAAAVFGPRVLPNLAGEVEAAPSGTPANVWTLQEGAQGAQVLEATCFGCHDITGIEDYGYAEPEVHDLLQRMIDYGAVLSDADYNTLVVYLAGGAEGETPASADDETPAELAEGTRILEATCFGCHDITGIEDYGYAEPEVHDLLQRMMGYGAVLSDADYNTLVAYLAGGAEGETPASTDDETRVADLAEGADLFQNACTACHDVSGITDYPGYYSEDDYREIVNNMIAYGASLNADQAELVVRYLTETYGIDAGTEETSENDAEGETDSDVDLAEGERLLQSACTTCHDVSGITDYPDTYNEAEFRDMIGRMLDYGAQLSEAEAETLLQYLVVAYGRD